MNLTDAPKQIPIPFANSGKRNDIPVQSQIGITNGAASLTDGFPPLTMTDESLGGIAPDGQDMNGILFLTSAVARWFCAGGRVVYNNDFASAIGGYPKGATLSQAATPGALWVSSVDSNTSNPDTYQGAGAPTGWLPLIIPGFNAIEQGGGPTQLSTKLNIGMTSAQKLRLAVNGADRDNIALEQWVAQQVLTEQQARNTSETGIFKQISDLAQVRYDQDLALSNAVVNEATQRQTGINNLYTILGSTVGGNATQRFIPGDNFTVPLQLAFTNTQTGFLHIVAALNVSSPAPVGVSNNLNVNGSAVAGDTTLSSQVSTGVVYCNGNGATVFINQVVTTPSANGAPFPAMSQQLSYIFVPN